MSVNVNGIDTRKLTLLPGSGICPYCLIPISEHDAQERKVCHDALSGYQRPHVHDLGVTSTKNVFRCTICRRTFDFTDEELPEDGC